MATLKEMIGIKPKVEFLLTEYPHTRDDDNKLIANIWHNELTEDIKTVHDFLMAFSQGKFSSPESIRRMRQKLQEENEELRGSNQIERLAEAKNVRNNINN